jgi:phytoene desaturase
MQQQILVIGSGFGGMSAAIRLAAAGHKVTILEKRDRPGGRAYVFQRGGYTFDSGPTVITVPFQFDQLWATAGKKREEYFSLEMVQPFYRLFNHEGRFLEYGADEEQLIEEIRRWNPADVEGYQRFIAAAGPIFEKGFALIGQPFLTVGDMLKVAPDLIKLKSYTSVYQFVSQYLQDDFLRRCFSFHPLFIGGNPFDSTSIYAMVHYLERKWSVWHARGGTGAIVQAMLKLFSEIGGTLELNADVAEILVEGRRVKGVRLVDGRTYKADTIVSNADVVHTYRDLIPSRHRRWMNDRNVTSKKFSMSLAVIYLGINRRYDDGDLVQHNIIFSERYRELLSDIFNRRVLADDFSLYLHRPSHTDQTLAPAGHESMYVLAPVPNLGAKVDWSIAAPKLRQAILEFLELNYMPGLRRHIVMEHMVDPRYYRDALNSHLGAGFSIQPLLWQSAWFRPHNRSEDFENLYLVGAGTHPGAGLPGVIASGAIAANLIGSA